MRRRRVMSRLRLEYRLSHRLHAATHMGGLMEQNSTLSLTVVESCFWTAWSRDWPEWRMGRLQSCFRNSGFETEKLVFFPNALLKKTPVQVYQLRGRYPNKDYPKIFNDKRVGEEAKKLFDDAQELLATVVREKWITATAVVGVYRAFSSGDDIKVLSPDDSGEVIETFYGM
ncbi:hypothetical protein FOZ62_014216, partial [Perkinsus olseni]